METSTTPSARPGDPAHLSGSAGNDLASEIKEHASDIQQQARAKVGQAARSGQSAAADELHEFAEGVRRSVESWDESRHSWVRRGLNTAADSLDGFSDTLRHRNLADLAGEVEETARRHPLVFAAGCALAGFALVRFLKSDDQGRGDGSYRSEARERDSGRSSVSGLDPASSAPSSEIAQGNT